jgi:hypothetical protein
MGSVSDHENAALPGVGSIADREIAFWSSGSLGGDALAKAANLSDLVSAAAARANLGLGGASILSVGSGAGDVAAGDSPGNLAYQLAFGAGPAGVIKPWHVPVPYGAELWALVNFRAGFNVTELAPSLTPNSTTQTKRTLVSVGTIQEDDAFQLSGRVISMPNVGWAYIQVKLVDAGGTDLAGTTPQALFTNGFAHAANEPFLFDFKPSNLSGSGAFVEVQLQLYNNTTAGSGLLAIDNMSLRRATGHSRPMFFSAGTLSPPTTNNPILHQQIFNPATGVWQNTRTDFATDGALSVALGAINHFDGPSPWRYPPADPLFLAATGNVTTPVGSAEELAANALSRPVRVGNNDQILEVLKQDGVTWELRGNAHGGETLISVASPNLVYEVDNGDGVWIPWVGTGNLLRTCRRFRFTFNTQLARSAPDSDVFATVSHVATFFPDGMMRMDRTMTFTKAMTLRMMIDWMSSHSVTTPKLGRIGAGHQVTDEIDIYTKAARPVAPTAATATVGGVLPAATYTYTYTDLTEGGETTPAIAVTQVTTGSTSTVTLTLPAVPSGVTGRRIYGRSTGVMRQVLLTTLGPVTTWTDDGSIPAIGAQPPRVNTARRLDQPTSIALDSALSDSATWSVWKDLPTGMCFGNIFDRDAVLGRTGVVAARTKLEAGSGIVKNYILPVWLNSDTALIAGGTVWTATHWCMSYCPADPNGRWEQEIADRAAFLSSLKTLYPAT